MKFSIIIPIYNVEAYLKECLDSVLTQSFKDWEAILVDDGSTDSSAAIAETYVAKDSRFRILSQTNQGLSAARNTGIKSAHGEYLFFLDSDDSMAENGLKILNDTIEKNNAPEVIRINYESYNDTTKSKYPQNYFGMIPENKFNKLISGTDYWNFDTRIAVMAVLSLCRREFILKNQLFFVERLIHEDEEWTPILYLHTQTMIQIPDVIYQYRIREKSITANATQNNTLLTLCKIIEIHYEKLQKINTSKSIKDKFTIFLWDRLFILYFMSKSETDVATLKCLASQMNIPQIPKHQIYAHLFKIHPSLYRFAVKISTAIHFKNKNSAVKLQIL